MSDTTDGATFNVGQLLNTRPAMQRRFLDVLARLVVQKATERTCVDCQCIAEDGRSTTVCRSCDVASDSLTWVSGFF